MSTPGQAPRVRAELHWSAGYLGLAPEGVSCWALVRLIYAEQRGIELPAYAGAPDAAEAIEINAALTGDAAAWPWQALAREAARPFDLVTFRLRGVEGHVGIVTWPGAFLHVGAGITSRIERYSDAQWRPLVARFLRYKQ